MIQKQEWSWDQEESAFPTREIPSYEWFLAHPSDDQGQTDMLQVRVDPEIGRRIDELIQVGKEQGIPMKTRSDFLRFSIMRGLADVREYLDFTDELFDHWMLLENQLARTAAESSMMTKVNDMTSQLVAGLEVLTSDEMQEWEEARARINEFLNLVLRMAGDQDFLVKTYIRGLFRSASFQKALGRISEHTNLGGVINNAMLVFKGLTADKVG